MNNIAETKASLDTLYSTETPEGVELNLHVAGPLVRFLAFLIDIGIRLGISFALIMLLAALQIFGDWLILIILFFLEWFYPVVFEVLKQGKTPGKKIMGIQVIMQNGAPVGLNASIIRNLLRAADAFFGVYAFGLISMFCSRGFRRLGDLAAGTLVVYSEGTSAMTMPRNWQISSEIIPNPPSEDLTPEDQRAIVSFAGRASILGEERSEELARLVTESLGKGNHNEWHSVSSVTILLSIAAWIRNRSYGKPDGARESMPQ